VALVRPFEGDAWILEAKATYDFTQLTNGRQAHFCIVFATGENGQGYYGSGKITTVAFTRDNDMHVPARNSFNAHILEDGQSIASYARQGLSPSTPDTWYIRVTRQGTWLSVELKNEGDWFEAFPPVQLATDPGDEQTIALEADSWLAVTHSYVDYDYIHVEPLPIPVLIDIKPGSDPNSINCNNERGVIPVAILTSDEFDAQTVDHTTVTFEGASETHVDRRSEEPRRHEEDVDGDGDIDLIFHFRLGETNLTCDSVTGTLIGSTFGGRPIEGTDAVRMIDRGGR
jgi:hypothetical protein